MASWLDWSVFLVTWGALIVSIGTHFLRKREAWGLVVVAAFVISPVVAYWRGAGYGEPVADLLNYASAVALSVLLVTRGDVVRLLDVDGDPMHPEESDDSVSRLQLRAIALAAVACVFVYLVDR